MGLISFIMDLYENTRKTTTEVKKTKPQERKYDFDAGFTGSKKIDCMTKPVDKKKAHKKSERNDEGT